MTTSSPYSSRVTKRKDGRTKPTSDWETNWLITISADFSKLPDASRARHHDGWQTMTSPVSEVMEDAPPSHIPTPPPSSMMSTAHDVEMETIMRARLGVPYPELLLPIPTLELDFRLAVKLRKARCMVNSGDGAAKELTVVESGTWAGSFGKGVVRVSTPTLLGEDVEREFQVDVDPFILTGRHRSAGTIYNLHS